VTPLHRDMESLSQKKVLSQTPALILFDSLEVSSTGVHKIDEVLIGFATIQMVSVSKYFFVLLLLQCTTPLFQLYIRLSLVTKAEFIFWGLMCFRQNKRPKVGKRYLQFR
jgi:hypothetical protein